MIITLEERREDPYKERLWVKLASVRSHIQHRCLNPSNDQYVNYGGRGVTIDESWIGNTDNFLRDVDLIDGWDEDLFMKGVIQLDKDFKDPNSKHYSKDTCTWVTRKQNMQILPSKQKEFWAYNEYTGEIKDGFNQNLFSIEHRLSKTTVSSVLRGRKHRAGDWWMWYKDSTPPTPKVICARLSNGDILWDVNPRRLSIKIGKSKTYVNAILARRRKGYNISKGAIDAWEETINLEEKIADYKGKTPTNIERANQVTGLLANE